MKVKKLDLDTHYKIYGNKICQYVINHNEFASTEGDLIKSIINNVENG